MKRLVCESLYQFYKLNEDIETAKQLFTENNINPGDDEYDEFFNLFSNVPDEDIDIFANWVVKDKIDPYTIHGVLNQLKGAEIILDKPINHFIKFKDFKLDVKEKIIAKSVKTQTKEDPQENKSALRELTIEEKQEEDENKRQAVEFARRLKEGVPLMGYTLWVYAVLARWKGVPYVKFGETYKNTRKEAETYALKHTFLKGVGLSVKEDLIFCEDVTEFARSWNEKYVYKKRQQFDDAIRDRFPGKIGPLQSESGRSDEFHEHDPSETDEQIKKQWNDALHKLLHGEQPKSTTPYTAREFHNELSEKITTGNNSKSKIEFNRFLMGATTGIGKEVATLSTIIQIHDERPDLFNKNTLHVACATIPITAVELLQEMSKGSEFGVTMASGKTFKFSRIKPYCLSSFENYAKRGLKGIAAKEWFIKNVTIKDKIDDIDFNDDYPNTVPVLFGSFPDLGLKAKIDLKGKYTGMGDRMGILSIGEAHQFLNNIGNVLWDSIQKTFGYKFLLLITGTPIDYIFNDTHHLYFPTNQRTLFTRTDLYEEKKKGELYQNIPNINYYELNVADIIEEMRKDPRWEDDKHGFTFKKLFEKENKTSKTFKYQRQILDFFRKLLSVPTSGFDEPSNFSIERAPNLCDYAKKHILIALPTGTKDSPAGEYIEDLVNLLKANGVVGDNEYYKPFLAFKNKLKDIKEFIETDTQATATFTCNKLLVGTNIPNWGSLIFLRKMGNSVKFFEQATGRLVRGVASEKKKTNVGVFLGDINNVMDLTVSTDQKVSLGRNEKLNYRHIVRRALKNYNYYQTNRASWQQITNVEDAMEIIERISGNVDFGLNACLENPKAPKDFDQVFKNIMAKAGESLTYTSQGGEGAKDSEVVEATQQLIIKFEDMTDRKKERYWRNMIKQHIIKMILMCRINGWGAIEICADKIEKAIKTGDNDTLSMIGEGVLFIPEYINDDSQIDRAYINAQIAKVVLSKKIGRDGIVERHAQMNRDIYKTDDEKIFDPKPLTDEMISIFEKRNIPLKQFNNILVFDKNASFTISILEQIGYENINKLTIVAIDKLSEGIIRAILGKNVKPERIKCIKNINRLLIQTDDMPKFDVIAGNPPYQPPNSMGGGLGGNIKKLYVEFVKQSLPALKPGGYMVFIHPGNWRSGMKKITKSIGNDLRDKILYLNINTAKKYFKVGSNFDWYLLKNEPNSGKAVIETDEGKTELNLKEFKAIPNKVNDTVLSILKTVLYDKNTPRANLMFSDERIAGDSDKKTPTNPYPLMTSGEKFKDVRWYGTKKHPLQDEYKAFMSNIADGGSIHVGKDYGTAGLFGTIVKVCSSKEETDMYYEFFNSKLFRAIVILHTFNRFVNGTVILHCPMLDIQKYDKVNGDFYKYFNLNKYQISYIEKVMQQ